MYPFIHINLELPTYWLLSFAGMLVCVAYAFLTNRRGKAGRIPNQDLLHILLLAVLGVLVGGKIMGVITSIPFVIQNWDALLSLGWPTLLSILWGGLVFYGGMLGAFATTAIYCKKYKISIRETAALLAPVVPLFHVFGRIGCFFGGCCYGIKVPWGVTFTHSMDGGAPNGVPLLPIQLIEAGCNLIIFIVVAILSRRLKRKWMALPAYIVIYGVVRFVLEFFRGDKIRGVAILSSSQWISLALIITVAVLYFTKWRKEKLAVKVQD